MKETLDDIFDIPAIYETRGHVYRVRNTHGAYATGNDVSYNYDGASDRHIFCITSKRRHSCLYRVYCTHVSESFFIL